MRVGVDTGGTFTDVVTDDGRILKVPSTPSDPGAAVRAGVEAAGGGTVPALMAHGTTVATNALLERRGAVVTLVTDRGFADVIEIARQDRPSLYDPWADRPSPLVDRSHRVEVGGRIGSDGQVIEPIEAEAMPAIPDDTGAVAVCLLHSDLNPQHETHMAARLEAAGCDVSTSSAVSPQFREYERTVTTVANAYLRPVCRTYLRGLSDAAAEVLVMTSAAGLVPVADGADLPVSLLLSGPAGGVLAAAASATAAGWPHAVTFDMGGTSTDVCLVLDGVPEPSGERTVAGFPIRMPSLDIHTIGAGGGSIAALDPGGALAVGPRSAGAVPGPACYGLGGAHPTVTDADLAAGRLPADAELPGIGRLDVSAARSALAGEGIDAHDVITVVDAAMEEAVRAVSVARGVDPTGLALVAFGGAGPLHACAIAASLGMPAVVVPGRAGVLSAVGCLTAPRQHDLVRTWPGGTDHTGLEEALDDLAREAVAGVVGGAGSCGPARSSAGGFDQVAPADGSPVVSGRPSAADGSDRVASADGPEVQIVTELDCRYQGQSHEIRVSGVADFAEAHQRRNGYARPGTAVEVVAIRASARVLSPLAPEDLPVVDRQAVAGPAVIAEADCTVWVPEGWRSDPHPSGSLVLTRVDGRPPAMSASPAAGSAAATPR